MDKGTKDKLLFPSELESSFNFLSLNFFLSFILFLNSSFELNFDEESQKCKEDNKKQR